MSPLSRCFEKPYFSCYFKVSPTFTLTCMVTRKKSHVAIFVIYGCRLSVPQLWCQDSLSATSLSALTESVKYPELTLNSVNGSKLLGINRWVNGSIVHVLRGLLYCSFCLSFKKGSVWVLRSGRTDLHLRGFWIQGHKVRHPMCLKHLILEDQC